MNEAIVHTFILIQHLINETLKSPLHSARVETNDNSLILPHIHLLLKLSRAESGHYLDGRPPGKTRLLLEEVLVRPAGGLTLQSVWVLTPQYIDGDTIP